MLEIAASGWPGRLGLVRVRRASRLRRRLGRLAPRWFYGSMSLVVELLEHISNPLGGEVSGRKRSHGNHADSELRLDVLPLDRVDCHGAKQ